MAQSQSLTDEAFADKGEKRKYSLRRSQLEIQMDILKVVREGAYLPTQIMYKANLAWVALQDCLQSLVRKGLLVKSMVGSRRNYQLSTRGATVLHSYDEVVDSMQDQAGVSHAVAW